MGTKGLSLQIKGPGIKLITHLHLMLMFTLIATLCKKAIKLHGVHRNYSTLAVVAMIINWLEGITITNGCSRHETEVCNSL